MGGEARDQEFEVSLDCITPCLNRTKNIVCVAGRVNTECILQYISNISKHGGQSYVL